jgi:5'-methylthioadenosine phosphorylase
MGFLPVFLPGLSLGLLGREEGLLGRFVSTHGAAGEFTIAQEVDLGQVGGGPSRVRGGGNSGEIRSAQMAQQVPIGIIGGSGLYEIEGLKVLEEREVDTPFGPPSAPLVIGELGGRRVAFLPRHGRHHEFSPSTLPYRANIWAMKQAGVFWLMAVNAVGSLREEIAPGQFVIPHQIIDKTHKRPNTLYDGFVAHVSLAEPFEAMLRQVLIEATRECGVALHERGTYVCMEGPAFSTVAESHMHRAWGADIVGMTAMPEARLAREAEMSYASIALPTDYDSWKDDEHVDITSVLAILNQNISNVKRVLAAAIPRVPVGREEESAARHALRYGIMTKPAAISAQTRRDFALVLDQYIK